MDDPGYAAFIVTFGIKVPRFTRDLTADDVDIAESLESGMNALIRREPVRVRVCSTHLAAHILPVVSASMRRGSMTIPGRSSMQSPMVQLYSKRARPFCRGSPFSCSVNTTRFVRL